MLSSLLILGRVVTVDGKERSHVLIDRDDEGQLFTLEASRPATAGL